MAMGCSASRMPAWHRQNGPFFDRTVVFGVVFRPVRTKMPRHTVALGEPAKSIHADLVQAIPGPSPLARWVALLRTVGERADDHDADMVAAGLSFYALLGLFPGMLAIISIYGLVADPATVQSVLGTFASTLPPQARAVVNEGLVAF